ncbi:MFS transporter [Metabacillus sp. 113a]|uniref:MFS transporter n=1 Tax=Metabacillus sp. 113a TaxID=3404706 RepID=UPI003CF76DFF
MDYKGTKDSVTKDDVTVVDIGAAKKAVTATSIGNAMEWFDFGIYSYLAVTIGKVFFPEVDGPMQLVYAFATFAVAFLVRPIGGIFFGMLGDRMGRKKVLAITLVMMAIATLAIGLIPSYESIGVTASILLLIARLVQGFSTGGEYSGAMTFIAESTPDKKRGIMASWLEVGTLTGYIAGSGLVTLLTFILGSETMLEWGWRIPFLIAGPIGIVGLYLRNQLEETPAFEAMEKAKDNKKEHISLKELLVFHKNPLLIGILLVFFYNVTNYMVLSYMPSHLTAVLGYGETNGLLLILIVMCVMIPIVLLMGYFSDRIGGKNIISGGLTGLIIFSVPAFYMIGTGNTWLVFLGILILAIFLAAFQGTMPSLLPSLYFTDVRYGALSITYNLSASLFGGTTPLAVAWLINETANNYVPSYYLTAASVIGIVVVLFLVKDPTGKPLRGSPPAVEKEQEIQAAVKKGQAEGLWWKEEKKEIEGKIQAQKSEESLN